eukprot:762804-Hanusia_phi.AAC.6
MGVKDPIIRPRGSDIEVTPGRARRTVAPGIGRSESADRRPGAAGRAARPPYCELYWRFERQLS